MKLEIEITKEEINLLTFHLNKEIKKKKILMAVVHSHNTHWTTLTKEIFELETLRIKISTAC
jgi:hypothetical protein